jgi:uncharacterized cupredoxin-like copper-binding protein
MPRSRSRSVKDGLGRLPLVLFAVLLAACAGDPPPGDQPFTAGTPDAPRPVIIVMRDYSFGPPVIDLVPGETVLFQVVNGGLDIHEAILGDLEVQLAWEAAEAETVGHPPGPTPEVSVPPELAGLRIVVESGQRRDATWTVPEDAPSSASGWFVGCHIPGHWERGMVVPVRFVDESGSPLGTPPPVPLASPRS